MRVQKKRPFFNQHGMTLVEGMVAVLVSLILITAMTAVTALISDARRALVARESRTNALARAADALQDPLQCGESLKNAPGGFVTVASGTAVNLSSITAMPRGIGAATQIVTTGSLLEGSSSRVSRIYLTGFVPIPNGSGDFWAQAYAQLVRADTTGVRTESVLSSTRPSLLTTIRIAADGRSCGGPRFALSRTAPLPDVPALPPVSAGFVYKSFSTQAESSSGDRFLKRVADPTRLPPCAAGEAVSGVDFSTSTPTVSCSPLPSLPFALNKVCNVKNVISASFWTGSNTAPTLASMLASGNGWVCNGLPGSSRNELTAVNSGSCSGSWGNWTCTVTCCGYNPNLPNVNAP